MLDFENKLYQEDLKVLINSIPIQTSNKNILITGASGLIGSHIIDALIYYNLSAEQNNEKKINIYAMSRNMKKLQQRFAYSTSQACLHLISQDVTFPLESLVEFDFIIHGASNADPATYALYPVETIKTNVIGTINVLEYSKLHLNVKIILLSSIEVYGKTDEEKFKESVYGLIDFNEIRSGYPESKRIAELLCRSYVSEYGVNAVIGRLGYIYGPTMTQKDNKVIAQFIRNIINSEDIVLKSKGNQRRSYCYVTDAVEALFCILFKGKVGEAYNIANSNSVLTIAEIGKLASDLALTKLRFELPSDLEISGFSRTLDAVLDEKKLNALGWNARYNMSSGLERTIRILK